MFMQHKQLPGTDKTSWWLDGIFLSLILGSLFFILLGSRPLFVPDEGRYAEIAREMFNSGDYVTPYLNHIKYFEKPALFYWLSAAAIKIGGLNLWALRSIPALLSLLGCLATYATARLLYGRTTGLLASLILGTSMLYFIMSHMLSLDLPVTIFLSISLYAFLLGTEQAPGPTRRLCLWGAALSAALAVLTKGLIGIVFPGMIVFTWLAVLGNWKLLKSLYLPSSILVFILVAAPWHLIVGHRNPEFFYFYFIEQHFLRYTTKDIGHYQPAWFFIPTLIIGFFPWIVFLPQAITSALPRSWQKRQDYKSEIFFLLWAALIFGFFSFSKSKLIPYIVPVFPPLAILTARYLTLAIQKNYIGSKLGMMCLMLSATFIAGAYVYLSHDTDLPYILGAHLYLYAAAAIILIGSALASVFAVRKMASAMITLITTMWLFLITTMAILPYVDTRTILPLAQIINAKLQAQDDVVTYNQYYQDLPFYLERRVSVLNWHNELSYGMQHQDTAAWMINDKTFWQRWHSQQRIFVIMGMNEYELLPVRHPDERVYVLGKTATNVLVSNQP